MMRFFSPRKTQLSNIPKYRSIRLKMVKKYACRVSQKVAFFLAQNASCEKSKIETRRDKDSSVKIFVQMKKAQN